MFIKLLKQKHQKKFKNEVFITIEVIIALF